LTLAHTSPVQLVEAMGAAWFIFVLALLLLSRPDRAEPLRRQSRIRVSPDTAPRALPLVHRPLLELPQAAHDNAPADAADVSQINGNPQELDNGHLLALIGISANERRCIPYGVVIVAEYVGPVSSGDEASWRTVDVIVCTIIGNDVYVVNFGHSGAHPFRLLG
jgi:hypothetical protein